MMIDLTQFGLWFLWLVLVTAIGSVLSILAVALVRYLGARFWR